MNKAFMREPDADVRVCCPRCGSPGTEVTAGPLNTHIRPESRSKLQDIAWYCSLVTCPVAYFNQFEAVVEIAELKSPIYPYDIDAPLCACFGMGYDDVEDDVDDGEPLRIRELLRRSQTPDAQCQTLAADGQCCMKEIQKLYFKLRSEKQNR